VLPGATTNAREGNKFAEIAERSVLRAFNVFNKPSTIISHKRFIYNPHKPHILLYKASNFGFHSYQKHHAQTLGIVEGRVCLIQDLSTTCLSDHLK